MIVSLLLNIVLKLLYCEFITRSTRKCLLLQFSRSASSLSRNTFWFDYAIVKNSLAETRQYCIASHRVNWFYFILCCKLFLHSIFLLINSFIASSRDVFFFHYPTGCCFHFEIPFNILIKKCLLSFFSISTAAAATESERKNQKQQQQNLMLWKCKLCNNFMHLCLSVHSSLSLSWLLLFDFILNPKPLSRLYNRITKISPYAIIFLMSCLLIALSCLVIVAAAAMAARSIS